MADALASLRQADANLYKTAMRAEQLQSAEPIVAYWCMSYTLTIAVTLPQDAH